MASSTDSDCHKDPNFAVICSFLDKYGESLGLPHVSYLDLETFLQDTTNNVSRVLVDIHVRLLRRIGKSSVSSDRFEKSIIKFCHHFSEFDAWEVESYGYKHANVKTKLRILKNLLESQFDFNLKFKEKVNESSAEEMRFLPIGRDKEGQAYWYFLDKELNLLIYKEEQDDDDADTWQLVCNDRQQLEKLVKSLKIDGGEEVKEEDEKNSSESRSSKEGSPDTNEIDLKEENADKDTKKAALKQEPDSIVKEEPVERDKVIDDDSSVAVKTESTESDSKSKKQNGPTGGGGKFEKDGDVKLGCKVELNVSIERLSDKSVEKYKKRKEDEKPPRKKQDRVSESAVTTDQAPPETSESGNAAQEIPEENGICVDKMVNATPLDEDQHTSLKDGEDGKDNNKNVSREMGKESEEETKSADCSEKGARDSSSLESKTTKPSKPEDSTDLKSTVSEQEGGTAVSSASKEDSFPDTKKEGCDKDGAKRVAEVQIKDKDRSKTTSLEEEEKGKDEEKKENVKPTEPEKDISADDSGKLKSETAKKDPIQITASGDTPSKSVVCDSDKVTEKTTSDLAEHENKQKNSNDEKKSDSGKSLAQEKNEQPAKKKVENALTSEQQASEISGKKSQKSLEIILSDPQVSNELKESPEKRSLETPQKAQGTDICSKVVEEVSNACQEKRKAGEGENASDKQPDANTVLEKCSEGTEKVSDSKSASDEGMEKASNVKSALDEGTEKASDSKSAADEGTEQASEAKSASDEGTEKYSEGTEKASDTKSASDEGTKNVSDAKSASDEGPEKASAAKLTSDEGPEKASASKLASDEGPEKASASKSASDEGTEKASDAKSASEAADASSTSIKGLADEEKKGEDNACADPGQSQLLKDPDRDKAKVTDTGTEEDGNERKSPSHISDAEEDFAETADDYYEVDDEPTVDKVPQSDDKETAPTCRKDGEASSEVSEFCAEVKSRGGEEPDVPVKGDSEVKEGAEVSGGDGVKCSGDGQKKCSEVTESSVSDRCGEDGLNAPKSSVDGSEKCEKDDKLDSTESSDQSQQKCGKSGQESGHENIEEKPKSDSSSSAAVEESKESSEVERVKPEKKKNEMKSKEEGSELNFPVNGSALSDTKTGKVSEEEKEGGGAVNEKNKESLEDEKRGEGKDHQESGDTLLKSSASDKTEGIRVQDSDGSVSKPKQSDANVEKGVDDSKSGDSQTVDAKLHSPKPSIAEEDGEKSVKLDETQAAEEKSSVSPKASLPESTDDKIVVQKDLKDEDKPKVAPEESEDKGEKPCKNDGKQDEDALKESEKPSEGNEKEVLEASSVSEVEKVAADDVKDSGESEKQQDKQSAAHIVPSTDETSEIPKPLEEQNTDNLKSKNNVNKESEEKKEMTEGSETRDESHDQRTADAKTDIKEGSKEDKPSDAVDAKSSEGEKNEPPRKRTRRSETQRTLKRAAPEPASDDFVESEPNGKRAKPTARVQKTRGGRDAAARGRVTRLANKDSESEDSESVAPVKSKRGCGRGRGRGGSRGRGRSRDTSSASKAEAEVKKAGGDDNEEEASDQASGKRAKKKKPDSSSEALSEEEVTPAKKGRNQIQSKNVARGTPAARGSRRGGRGGAKGAVTKKAVQTPAPAVAKEEDSNSRRRSARVKEMKARRPPTPSSPEEESEPTEDDDDEEGAEENYNPEKFFLEASFTPEEESGDEEFKPKGRNFQRQAARTTKEKNEEINDDTPCVKCGKYNHPEMILLCDKCDAGYHTACLRPPLMVIPDGDWFCPPCEHSMLVERLFACLQSLDLALKKRDRLSKRQERLAYVGISINNILHGGRPCQVSEKFGRKPGDAQSGEEAPEEEVENAPSEASSSYESEDDVPERQFRSARLAMRQAEKRSRREHKRRKPSRAQSPDIEVFAKRTCRTRSSVSYQFKEFDELISNAIDDDQPIRREKPPGRSRGKDMSNILGASDEEDEKIRQRDGLEPVEIPVVKRKPKRRLTGLDDSEEEDADDDSEEFKISEDTDSDATEVEEENGDEDGLSEEESDSGDWKPKKTWYNSRNNRSNRRKKFVVDDDDEYESDENASKRRSTRNSTRGRIKYDDWDSEEEEETEETEEEEASFSDFSSDDSRFARKMRKEREKRKSKGGDKEGKKKSKRNADDDDEEESEGSVSDSSMVRKRKMLMKLVKKRRKDASGDEDSEEAEISKSRIKSRKVKRKAYSDDDTSTTEDDSDEEESNEPRMKKKNVLRSSDEEEEEEVEKPTADETATKDKESVVVGNSALTELEAKKSQLSEEPPIKATGKRESPTKAAAKGKKRGDGMNLKTDGTNEVKDEPVPGKVRRVSGSDKEGAAEPNLLLKTASPPKKVLPSRRARGISTEGSGEVPPEKKVGSAAGNRRSSTEKLTRSGKKKKLPNFLDVPSGGESDEGEVKPPTADASSTPVSKSDQLMSSAQPMPLGAQPHMGPGFPPQQNQGPQPPGFPPNQRFGGPQGGHQFNPAFVHHGQMGPPHLRPGLRSSPPHSMANVSSTGSHEEATSLAQMPPHYSAPPGHPGNTGLTAANMRGPYPRYNGMPPQMPPQGMPPHMMNQALEPGQIPPSMSQPPHGRHPHPLPPQQQQQQQQPPHGMGHDQAQASMMQQQQHQQWADQRGPGQPPGYGNAPRMPYPRDMVPRQPYYHHHHHRMRSPPPSHGSMAGQYPPNMGSSMNNPLTSMGQMTRNLSQGMKSPPPRPVGEAGGEDGGKAAAATTAAAAPKDMQVKLEVKQEMAEKEREAETATPEKKAGKAGGKRAKASSPKSQPERLEGEEPAGNKGQVPQAGGAVPPISMPSSTAPLPPYQPHPYMNSQQGFFMSQQYRMQYGGPNQGPMNQMRGVPPPHHNPYMTPNHPFPGQQGHRPYLPAGQQQPGMPPNSVSGQTTLPPSTMPGGQQSQPDTTPHQQMAPSGMLPNPNFPVNQQRPPSMNAGHQGPPDSNSMMVPPGGYPQRPPGMPPSQTGAPPPGMMPPHMRPPIMAHQVGPPSGMPPGQTGPHARPHGQTGPPHSAQGAPGAPGQGQPPQGAAGVPQQTQQPAMNVPPHSQGSQSASPTSSQGEPAPTMRGPHMGPYHPMPMKQPGAPSQPAPPAESGGGQAEGESVKCKSEPQAAATSSSSSSSSSSGTNKTQESDAAAQDHKPAAAADKPVKEEPKAAQQEEKPQGGETVPLQSGQAPQPGNAGGSSMLASQSGDPNVAVSNASNNRNFPPPGSMNQAHPGGQGGPPMPYYNPGPYYHQYGNMPPQGQHMHPQARWAQNMPPYGLQRFGGHGYPPYGMSPEAMNMNMMPGQQGMHGNAGAPPHPQGNPNTGPGPAGTPPHSAVPSTPPHPGVQAQDFQAPRDQPAVVRNRRSSSTDSRPGVSTTATTEGQLAEPANSNNSSQPQSSPTVSSPSFSPSMSVKSEHLPTVSSPSSSSSVSQSSSSTATTAASTLSVSQQQPPLPLPVPTSSPKSTPSKNAAISSSDLHPETPGGAPAASPAMSVGLQSTWSGPGMNHQYSHAMSHMQRMGHPGPYMPPYGPQGMMPTQSHNPYMMGLNPRHANSQGQGGQGSFDQYPGGHMALPHHGMGPGQGVNQPPMSFNGGGGGYRPPYMPPHPQGHDHPAMPPRPDFGGPEGQGGPNAPEMGGGRANESRPPPPPSGQIPPPPPLDSQTNEGGGAATAPKAKRAKTQKKKDVNLAGSSSPRGKGSRGRGRGRGGFTIDSLLQARGVGREEEEGEDSGEMKDIVNYVTTDEYIKQQTSS